MKNKLYNASFLLAIASAVLSVGLSNPWSLYILWGIAPFLIWEIYERF